MVIKLDLQIISKANSVPSRKQLQHWITAALKNRSNKNEITIRIVDTAESAKLNKKYRHKNGPTNILSFPFETPPELKSKLLGDIVICAPLVAKEAKLQGKTLQAHWAHLVIHGVLHLLGYDHIKKKAAEKMEKLETQILQKLNFPDPYIQ